MGCRETGHTLTWDYRLLEIQIINKVIKDLPTYLRMGKKAQKAINQIGAMKKNKSPCERAEKLYPGGGSDDVPHSR